ncbi:hypothetical protein UlMin_008198 [Ulmus minor]
MRGAGAGGWTIRGAGGCQYRKVPSILTILKDALLLSIHPRFLVEKNSFRVTSPDRISGTHDSAIGNFVICQYGGSMAGNVLYPKDNRKGCKEFSEFGISFQSKPGAPPTFVLVDRGKNIFFLWVYLSPIDFCKLFRCYFLLGSLGFHLFRCSFLPTLLLLTLFDSLVYSLTSVDLYGIFCLIVICFN